MELSNDRKIRLREKKKEEEEKWASTFSSHSEKAQLSKLCSNIYK